MSNQNTSRYKESLAAEKVNGLTFAPRVNLAVGGQNGHMPNIARHHSNAAYIRKNIICKVLEMPDGFRHVPDGPVWIANLKSICEMHALTWEGFNATLTVNSEESVVGASQANFQQTPSNVVMARTEPVMTVEEKYNLSILESIEFWQTEFIMNQDTKFADIFTRGGSMPTDWLPNQYSATMIFFEPDPTFTYALRVWICTNMYPMGGLENTAKRSMTDDGERIEYTIPWSALTQTNTVGCFNLANKLLADMRITGTSPTLQPAIMDDAAANVKDSKFGYTEQLDDAQRDFASVQRSGRRQ